MLQSYRIYFVSIHKAFTQLLFILKFYKVISIFKLLIHIKIYQHWYLRDESITRWGQGRKCIMGRTACAMACGKNPRGLRPEFMTLHVCMLKRHGSDNAWYPWHKESFKNVLRFTLIELPASGFHVVPAQDFRYHSRGWLGWTRSHWGVHSADIQYFWVWVSSILSHLTKHSPIMTFQWYLRSEFILL